MKIKDALTVTFPPGTRIDTEFTCPECGSHCFGTTKHPSSGLLRGWCHGTKMVEGASSPCGFTWGRTDDFKVFRVVVFADNGVSYRELWDRVHNADRGVRGKV